MPRTANDVLERLFCLRALLFRTQLEVELHVSGASRAEIADRQSSIEAAHASLSSWLMASSIAFSPIERTMLADPLGGWKREEVAQLMWRTEAVATLLWTIGLLPAMPPYANTMPLDAVISRLDELPLSETAPPLRSEPEIERALELAELWHWRARTEILRRQGKPAPADDSYEATVARAMASALEAGLIDPREVANHDFAISAMRYADTDESTFMELSCVAFERHVALTWVNDPTTAWDTVNPST